MIIIQSYSHLEDSTLYSQHNDGIYLFKPLKGILFKSAIGSVHLDVGNAIIPSSRLCNGNFSLSS